MRLLTIIPDECIWVNKQGVQEPGPKYGEEVTAVGEKNGQPGYTGITDCYILKEYPCPEGYAKRGFIPLTGEKEEIEQEKTELCQS